MTGEIKYTIMDQYPELYCRTRWLSDDMVMTAAGPIAMSEELLVDTPVSFDELVLARQVHGSRVVPVIQAGIVDECDGLVSGHSQLALVIRTADCAAVMAYDEDSGRIANLHVGWRGARAGIIGEGIKVLLNGGKAKRSSLRIAVGPMIQSCCYEVGDEFYGIFSHSYLEKRHNHLFFDLKSVIRDQLYTEGIEPHQIEFSGECTRCSGRHLPSYRRDNTKNRLHSILYVKEV